MVCDKCGSGYMIDDSYTDIKVYKCWVCGNRIYVDYPKRSGSLVCARCGDDLGPRDELGYCGDCLKFLPINAEPMKERTYGETTCACGKTFTRKSPTQTFHAKECKRRAIPLQV